MMKTIFAGLGWILVSAAFAAAPAFAGAPLEQTKQSVDKVLSIVRDPNLKPAAKQAERRQQLRDVIYPRFDFTEMAKRSLGAHWARRSPQEQQEFLALFQEYLVRAYSARLGEYGGEPFRVTGVRANGSETVVTSEIVRRESCFDESLIGRT